jgi:hypothetical protein
MKNMDKKAIKIMPPLRIWAFLLIALVAIGIIVFFGERKRRLSMLASRNAYLEKGFQQGDGRPVVLIIGSSLVECDLSPSDSIEKNIRQSCNYNVKVVKLWKRSATIAEIINGLPILRNVHPNLVVIEANLFFYRPFHASRRTLYMQTYNDMISWNYGKMNYAPDSVGVFGPITRAGIEGYRYGLIDTNDLRSFGELAGYWQSKGTQFLLVNFPIEELEEIKKWNSPDTLSFRKNLQFLKKKISFTYVDGHLILGQSDFYDYLHMNKKGISIFSSFFCRALCFQFGKS